MKRLIAAILTATTMTLAACTATAGTDPSTTPEPTTTASPLVTTSSTASVDPVESWLSGTTTTSTAPGGTSTTAAIDRPTTTSADTSGDMYDAIPVTIPDTIIGADLKVANQAAGVWRHAMRVIDESLKDPAGKDWKPLIYRYVNDPAALKQMALINTFVKQGIRQVGDIGYTAEVLSAAEHNVQIKACVDLSKYDVVNNNGDSVLERGTPPRFSRTFSISLYYDQDPELWFLNDIKTPNPVEPC